MKQIIASKKKGWRYWLRLVAFGLASGFVILILAQAHLLSNIAVQPAPSQVCCRTPADDGVAYEAVTLTAPDGTRLYGWYIPSANGAAVVLLHGYGGNRLSMLEQAYMLARNGYGALLYDLRASGESEGEKRSWGWQDVADVPAALAYLQDRPDVNPDKLGILGCSSGAEVALASAALYPQIKAVVADGAGYAALKDLPPPFDLEGWMALPFSPVFLKFIEWKSGARPQISLVDAVPQIAPRPLLLITAEDGLERVQADRFYEMAEEPKERWHIPDAYHCGGPQVQPQEYEARILALFERAFGEESGINNPGK